MRRLAAAVAIGIVAVRCTGLAADEMPGVISGTNSRQLVDLPLAELLAQWTAAVGQHVPGARDRAAAAIAAWPDSRLNRLLTELTRVLEELRRHPSSALGSVRAAALGLTSADEVVRRLKRAAVLHADIPALMPEPNPEARRPIQGSAAGAAVSLLDGEARTVYGNPLHWTIGRALVGHLPRSDPFVRLWYRATAAYLANKLDLSQAIPHLDAAIAILPLDPVLLMYAGAAHEHNASAAVQVALRTVAIPHGFQLRVGSEASELERAHLFLRRALRSDASLAEARTRFGRVLSLLGDFERAAEELAHAVREATDRRIEYLGWLFLARVEEQRGRWESAIHAFGRALALYPRAQSPRLGLSLVAWKRGDDQTAVRNTQQAVTLQPEDDDDPFWWYHVRPATEVNARWSEMHIATPGSNSR